MIFWNLIIFFVFCLWQTSLLCIVGEPAGGWSVAAAVGVDDVRQVIRDRWHMKRDLFPFFIGATICTCQEIQCRPYA